MQRTLLVLTLTGLAVLATAGDAQAQRRGFGGWGVSTPRFSVGVGRGGYYSQPGYYDSYYGGRAYRPYYQDYGFGYSRGYYQPYVGGVIVNRAYYTPTEVANPATYEAAPALPATTYADSPTAQQSVTVTVVVPTANTQVWFGKTATTPQGIERRFQSPPLEPGKSFTYTIRARWMENGRPAEQVRQVDVHAGQKLTVKFGDAVGEDLPAPDATTR